MLLTLVVTPSIPAMGTGASEISRGTAGALRLLHANCLACHDEEKQKGGLILATREGLLKGGENGPVIEPGAIDSSRLLHVLAADADPHMPPKGQLTSEQVDVLRRWLADGAPWDPAVMETLRRRVDRPIALELLPEGYHPVHAIALSADGARLAFGRGAVLELRDAAATNYPVIFSAPLHTDVVRSLAWSRDGRLLASGAFRELKVWNPASHAAIWSVGEGLAGRLTALHFTPHGGVLIAADSAPSEAGWVRLFDSETGAPRAAWLAHDDSIFDLAVSPDGGLLATAGGDRLVKLWELVSQKEVARFEAHAGAVLGLEFSPGATELVTIGADRQIKLWDVPTREAVVTIGPRKHALTAVAWSRDGSRVIAADQDGSAFSFEDFKRHTGAQSSATAKERRLGHWDEMLHAVAVTADGSMAFAGAEDGVVYAIGRDGDLKARLDPREPPGSPDDAQDTSVASAASEGPIEAPDDKASASSPTEAGAYSDRPGASAPSFVRDVLPVLAKAGCSAGSCHAKAEGQNGFHLSVFSYDPRADHAEIVKDARGRRILPGAPDESLLLLKPMGILKHGGGQRITQDSDTHQLLKDWIRGGMVYRHPGEAELIGIRVEPHEGLYATGAVQALTVQANYSDDSVRDVTHLADFAANDMEVLRVSEAGMVRVGNSSGDGVVVARYMGRVDASRITVRPPRTLPEERYAPLPVHNLIDSIAYRHFKELGLFPSEVCTDAEFLRRASLDTIGRLPTVREARAFLRNESCDPEEAGSADPAKSARQRRGDLIDELLARPEFGDYWANKWADLLRPNPDRVGVKSVFTLDQWLRACFRDNTPYDEFVRQILLAEGSNHRDGPIVIYRDRREPPELVTMFSQLFLGVRLECAKCHHHPNEKWSQEDFYQFAAVFGSVRSKGAGLSPPISAGTETFYAGELRAVSHPVTGAPMTPRPPDGPELPNTAGTDPRRAFAEWLTDPENPHFARAAVNRVWAAFFGRGFVEPVDDFRISNPASNEELLSALAGDFARHGYDLKHLMRTILNSRLYQFSGTPNEYNLHDTRHFSRSYRRRLPAEVLLDAVNDITGAQDEFNGCPPGTRAMQTWSYKVSSHFLDAFGRPNPSSDCPCERDTRASVVQALHLMNSPQIQEKLASSNGQVQRWVESPMTTEELITEIYLATLARFPTPREVEQAMAAYGHPDATRRTATEDILWALLNSPEFVFNH
jgi:WD40 repeat protein